MSTRCRRRWASALHCGGPDVGSGLRLGRVRGTPIVLYPTAILLIVFIAYLSWPSFQRGFSTPAAVVMALGVAVGLLITILMHELGHVAAARAYRIHTTEVSLFGMGGMARLAAPPGSPLAEVVISVSGPLVSLAIGVALKWGVEAYVRASPRYGVTTAAVLIVLYQLGVWNLFLGAFNLLPGPPLDGGGVVRGIAWAITKDRAKSVKVSGYTGLVAAAACGVLALTQYLGPGWTFPLLYAVLILLFGSSTAARGGAATAAAGRGTAGSGAAGASRMPPQAAEIAETVTRAREFAAQLGADVVTATHVLLGVLAYRLSLTSRVLGAHGVTFDAVWATAPRGEIPAGEEVPYSVPVRQMVEAATRSGRGRDGLLLALPENSDAAGSLHALGVDVPSIKRELESAIAEASRQH